MLLTLSENYTVSVALVPPNQVMLDCSVTEAALAQSGEDAQALFHMLLEKMPAAWQHLPQHLPDNPWVQGLAEKALGFAYSLILVTDAEIQAFNRDYRGKDTPTDVLSFPLHQLPPSAADFPDLPESSLGEIYISIDWAKATICKQTPETTPTKLNFSDRLSLFIIERALHGTLHLLGVHHDTRSAYNKVVTIQRSVIHAIF